MNECFIQKNNLFHPFKRRSSDEGKFDSLRASRRRGARASLRRGACVVPYILHHVFFNYIIIPGTHNVSIYEHIFLLDAKHFGKNCLCFRGLKFLIAPNITYLNSWTWPSCCIDTIWRTLQLHPLQIWVEKLGSGV